MNKQIEALKMAIDDARIGLGKVRQYLGWQEPKEDELFLEILKAWKTLDACKDALAEAEKQEPALELVNGEAIRSALPEGFTGNLYTHPAPAQPLSMVYVVYQVPYSSLLYNGLNPKPVAACKTLKQANKIKREKDKLARDYYYAVKKLQVGGSDV